VRSGWASCGGVFHDHAHEVLADALPSMRADAERKAAVARLLVTAGKLLSWPEKIALAARRLAGGGRQTPLQGGFQAILKGSIRSISPLPCWRIIMAGESPRKYRQRHGPAS